VSGQTMVVVTGVPIVVVDPGDGCDVPPPTKN